MNTHSLQRLEAWVYKEMIDLDTVLLLQEFDSSIQQMGCSSITDQTDVQDDDQHAELLRRSASKEAAQPCAVHVAVGVRSVRHRHR